MTLRPKIGNPFAIPPACYAVTFVVPAADVSALEAAWEDEALATSSFAVAEEMGDWRVQFLLPYAPSAEEIAARGGGAPQVEPVQEENWLAAVARDFPPLHIGRFFVHGAHVAHLLPVGAVPLQVEAGMAFGSGEHATTSGCLRAIDALEKRGFTPTRVLDMGCGSGILAIAAAKCWPRAQVLAVDVDAVSVRVARENVRINRAHRQVRCLCANGYASGTVQARGPYDLILANILARPLVQFSAALAEHLAPGGVAVLSGLLSWQEAYVLAAHRRQGLRLVRRYCSGGWSALVLAR